MQCLLAALSDTKKILQIDQHIKKEQLYRKIANEEIFVGKYQGKLIAYLRYNWFWDEYPFLNLLWVDQDFRNQGLGTKMLNFWEVEMTKKKISQVMTSSLANETAQYFYRKNGYQDCGALFLPKEPLEIIFLKKLSVNE